MISGANAAASGPTTTLLTVAHDEVWTAIAVPFGTQGAEFHAISEQAAAFPAEFVRTWAARAAPTR